MLVSILLTAYYSYSKNWIASNIFGLSFSVNAIQLLSLDSFKTGIILLSGLFVYDIFWVFYTPVMVSVATNFDAPIKLLWPRDIIAFLVNSENARFTMLGLGDIVIPGIFVALCVRFDRHMSWQRNPVGAFRSTRFAKPYFTANLIAYVLGLSLTMVVMHCFKAAQPALLYLSPACILSVLLTAAFRGELKELFAYTTEEEDNDKKKEKSRKVVIEQAVVEQEEEERQPANKGSIEIEEIELEEEEEEEQEEQEEEQATEKSNNSGSKKSKKRKNKK
jgi:minor histocompatibility antigen H13